MRVGRIAADAPPTHCGHYERHNTSAARRPHAADLASDRLIAEITPMRRPSCVGRNAAEYAPTLNKILVFT